MVNVIIPRVTTRGYYDRMTGATRKRKRYGVYPPNLKKILVGSAELAVMVHGMRNDSAGAASKVQIAKECLSILGYKHPVIGFSYDSDIPGAHRSDNNVKTLETARIIAHKNGHNLACFVIDFAHTNPHTKIRLLGHSLGSEVILSAIMWLHDNNHTDMLESVHFFAASIRRQDIQKAQISAMNRVIRDCVTNYHWPVDEVLMEGETDGVNPEPVGLRGMTDDTAKWTDIMVSPANHRFASYAPMLQSFP